MKPARDILVSSFTRILFYLFFKSMIRRLADRTNVGSGVVERALAAVSMLRPRRDDGIIMFSMICFVYDTVRVVSSRNHRPQTRSDVTSIDSR